MKERLIQSLRDVASIEFQRKYIVNGTKDEYILPQDLLSSLENRIADHLDRDSYRRDLSDLECKLLQALRTELQNPELYEAINSRDMTNFKLVEENPEWARIREAAKEILFQVHS
jgi:hypothetical protein